MTAEISKSLKTINRLTRKIELLESMIEDHSRQEYFDKIRRSAINALLELSLNADDTDQFLSLVLDLLFSVEALNVDKRGAVFLFDEQGKALVLRAHCNLSKAHIESIRHLPINHFFAEQLLSKNTISHSLHHNDQFIRNHSDLDPHGHYYVPIKTHKQNYGLILLFTANNTEKNSEDINFFSSIADICAGTLERINYKKQILDSQRNLEQQVEEKTRTLSQEKERLAVTLHSIGDGVITTDINGKIILINKITEQLTGWSQSEAVGHPIQDIFHIINKQTGIPCDNPVYTALASGKIIDLASHTTLIARNGTQYSIEDSGAPIFDEESNIIGAVLVFRDVTEKLRTAKELLKVKKLESVGILAGGIAHDFNNILVAILGNIELAEMYIDPASKAFPILREAQKASVRAKNLTQQLLTFSKGGEPVKKTISIRKIITESANFMLYGSLVSCRFNIPENLWKVDIDSGQISQVIQNLVINAKHAMPEGGEININCANIEDINSEAALDLPGKSYIKISIQDTGCGMTEKHLDKIFDPYFTTKQEGSGLGLAISNSIISKHKGHLSAQSKIGEGTTFTIYLAASTKPVSQALNKETHEPQTLKAKILVMDDEQPIKDIIKQMLVHLGHEVLLASDGQEAIDIFNEHRKSQNPIDVIIMDLTILNGMGGKDAVQEILKIDPNAKVIVSSGYSTDPIMANYKFYGFEAAISKPFLLGELNKTLTGVLSK